MGGRRGRKGQKAGVMVLRSEDLPLSEDTDGGGDVHTVEDEAVIRLLAEELAVGRRRVETGRLQVRRVTRERLADVDEPMQRVEAEVERVPVGQLVELRPPVRETEDEIIIPVVEEVIVVERRLMLKEEIHVRKATRVERHREQVMLRAQDVEIRRLPPRKSPAGT